MNKFVQKVISTVRKWTERLVKKRIFPDIKHYGSLRLLLVTGMESDDVEFNVSEPVTDKAPLTFSSAKSQPSEMTPMVKDLFAIKGIVMVSLNPYRIRLRRAAVYKWSELLPIAEGIIVGHLTK